MWPVEGLPWLLTGLEGMGKQESSPPHGALGAVITGVPQEAPDDKLSPWREMRLPPFPSWLCCVTLAKPLTLSEYDREQYHSPRLASRGFMETQVRRWICKELY